MHLILSLLMYLCITLLVCLLETTSVQYNLDQCLPVLHGQVIVITTQGGVIAGGQSRDSAACSPAQLVIMPHSTILLTVEDLQ